MSKPRGAAARKCCWVGETCLPVVPKSSLQAKRRSHPEIAIDIPARAPTGYSRSVAAYCPPPPPSHHRDDDELSVASTTCSVEGARRCSVAWSDASWSEIEEDAHTRGYIARHRVIGKGNSGVVFAGERTVGDETMQVAVKDVPLPGDEDARNMLETETKVHHDLRHPAIVRCYEVFFCTNRDMFSSVMELMDAGSLLDNLKLAGGNLITPFALSHVAKRMLEALAHLHEEELVIHRDVKPGNILLSHAGGVKLSDFGICAKVDGDLTQWVGTVTYMSPERLVGDDYAAKADVWSLGLVVAEAALGRYPYTNEDGKKVEFWDLLDLVVNGPSPADIVASSGRGSDACSLIDACTDKDPETRASAAQALSHPFVAGVDDRAGAAALQAWVLSVHAEKPTGAQHTARPGPALERRVSAEAVVLDAVALPLPPAAQQQQRRRRCGEGAGGGSRSGAAEKRRAHGLSCADKTTVILGESTLDKPGGMSNLLTVLKSAMLAN
ncbi:kinase-like domain-containing protein [Baffinella frigidus]|nr:kinase-like domain-containing protein [Cryptophyta sp. CCMP2293]